MLHKIDERLLRFFQKISDWLQIYFGFTNFHLAKLFLGVSFFSVISEKVQSFFTGKSDIFSIISIVLSALITWWIWSLVTHAEWSCKNNPVFRNPNEVNLLYWRYIEVFFLFVSLPEWIITLSKTFPKGGHELLGVLFYDLYRITFFFCVYFGSCTPKPPSPGKIREKLERIFQPSPKLSSVKN